MVLEGGRGGGQPARIYSSQESSRSGALKLYKLIGKHPLEKRKGKYRRRENVEQAIKKISWTPAQQLASSKPGDLFTFFLQSPSGGGRRWRRVEAVGVKKV